MKWYHKEEKNQVAVAGKKNHIQLSSMFNEEF